jgi:hypothetical protein
MKTGMMRFLKDAQAVMDFWKCSFVTQLCEEMRVQGERWMTEIAVSWLALFEEPDTIMKRIPVNNGSFSEETVHRF